MGTRNPFAPAEFYHLYNRGTEKRKIFLVKNDYERFVALLYLANGTKPLRLENLRRNEQGRTLLERVLEEERGNPLVSVAAYCLMPNHFHVLVKQNVDAGISRFMQKLSTAYTMYFNTRYKRSGTLFQGKFKSEHANNDRYLKYLIAYIHLNPKEISIPERYAYSSYADFVGEKRPQAHILNRSVLPEYFRTPAEFRGEIEEWLKYDEKYPE